MQSRIVYEHLNNSLISADRVAPARMTPERGFQDQVKSKSLVYNRIAPDQCSQNLIRSDVPSSSPPGLIVYVISLKRSADRRSWPA